MASTQLQTLFHFFAFIVNGFAAGYEYFVLSHGHDGTFGKFRFLTFWNICFQAIYFGWCLLLDIRGGIKTNQGTLQQWKDTFHACVVFPATVFVAVSFWALFALDRELIFPKAFEAFFPSWLNHLLHTTILPFILLEKILCHHSYPCRRKGLALAALFTLLYLSVVLITAYLDDRWVYPVLRVLSGWKRALFMGVCVVLTWLIYILGESMTNFIWGKKLSPVKMKTKARKS